MKSPSLAPRDVVVVYFACIALGWAALGVMLVVAPQPVIPPGSLRSGSDAGHAPGLMLALAVHAATVAILAWTARRWFFARAVLAVVWSALPIVVLLRELWIAPAFFYLIAVLYVSAASRHESPGRLQAPHRRSVGTGHA